MCTGASGGLAAPVPKAEAGTKLIESSEVSNLHPGSSR